MKALIVALSLFLAGYNTYAQAEKAADKCQQVKDKVSATEMNIASSKKTLTDLEAEYTKLYAPCEACNVGHKTGFQAKDCREICAQAKNVRKNVARQKKDLHKREIELQKQQGELAANNC